MTNQERLEEIINDLPYSVRHSGEIEQLKYYTREQAERAEELKTVLTCITEEAKKDVDYYLGGQGVRYDLECAAIATFYRDLAESGLEGDGK